MTDFARKVLSRAAGHEPAGRRQQLHITAGVHERQRQVQRQGGRPVQVRAVGLRPGRLARCRHLRQPAAPAAVGRRRQRDTYVTNKQFAARLHLRPVGTSLLEGRFGWSRHGRGQEPSGARTRQHRGGGVRHHGTADRPARRRRPAHAAHQRLLDLGRQATNPQWQYPEVWNPKVNYSWLVGRHSLKTGYEYQNIATEVQDVNPLYGRDTYNGQFTRPTGAAANNLYNLADFMFGLRAHYALSNILVANLRQHMHFLYIQDDWRRERPADDERSAALRVRHAVVEEGQHHLQLRSRRRTMILATDGSLEDRALIKPDRNNFGPRLGAGLHDDARDGAARRLRPQLHPLPPRGRRQRAVDQRPAGRQRRRHRRRPRTPARSAPRSRAIRRASPTRRSSTRWLANITYMPEDYHSSHVQSYYAVGAARDVRRT